MSRSAAASFWPRRPPRWLAFAISTLANCCDSSESLFFVEQERCRKFLAKETATVAVEQHDKLLEEKAALTTALAAARREIEAQRPALEKARADLSAAVQLQERLRKAGGTFKAQVPLDIDIDIDR